MKLSLERKLGISELYLRKKTYFYRGPNYTRRPNFSGAFNSWKQPTLDLFNLHKTNFSGYQFTKESFILGSQISALAPSKLHQCSN